MGARNRASPVTQPPIPSRILTVVSNLGLGGTERAAVNFASSYRLLGHDSRLLTMASGGLRSRDLTHSGVTIYAEPDSMPLTWRPDLIHLHSNGLDEGLVRRLIANWPDAVAVEQNVFSEPTKWADVIDISFQLTNACQRRFVAAGGRGGTAVIPNPVDTSVFWHDRERGEQMREATGIPQDALLLGRVGQPITYKWSPALIGTFNCLSAKHPNLYCMVVGAPPEVISQIQRSRYRSRIVSIPELNGDAELRAAYSAMDVFVHIAAQGESFGYVLTEAMLCETPIVTIATPWADNSQVEVIDGGGVAVRNIRDLKKAVETLMVSKTQRLRLGTVGRHHVLSTFAQEAVAQRALAIIDASSQQVVNPETLQAPVWNRLKRRSQASFIRVASRVLPKVRFGAWRWLPQQLAGKMKPNISRQFTLERGDAG